MAEASRKLRKKTSTETQRHIFSPALEDGPKQCGSQIGQQTGRCGPEVVRVNRSAKPENEKEKATNSTCGPNSIDLSKPHDLASWLANRCQVLLPTDGLTIYATTWKRKATPRGRSYWAHTASARRTSANGCTGWHTATTNGNKNPRTTTGVMNEIRRKGCLDDLPSAARVAGWLTPEASNALQGAKTPTGHNPRVTLTDQVAGWATPTARDHKSESSSDYFHNQRHKSTRAKPLSWQVLGKTSNGSGAETEKPGQLNPAFSCWLMGFRSEWLSCMD